MMRSATETTLLYRSLDGDRLEHARVRAGADGMIADGTVIGTFEARPVRLRFEITCDSRGAARAVNVESLLLGRDLLGLVADEGGIWKRVDGGTLDVAVFNCFDVAIALTPVPSGLTIRRLALDAGQSAIVEVAEIRLPSLTLDVVEHRYTALAVEGERSRYRIENLGSGVRSTVTSDADGIVIAVEGQIARVWPV